jgi:3',5'-cyclic AMP phosphodiesterase CpdA
MKRFLALVLLAVLASCASVDYSAPAYGKSFPAYPDTSFAVISDPHLFSKGLGVGEPAYEKIKYSDRKLWAESEEILATAAESVMARAPRFLLISGDLTKDGERANHEALAASLERFVEAGIRVYVVPGNHDVLNPTPRRYEGDKEIPVPNVTPEEFASIYARYGYGSAIAKDPSSLSYVAELEPGLWLLAMDACRWDLNAGRKSEHTGGSFPQARVDWIRARLEEAKAKGVAVIGMMHHGLLEHFEGQKAEFSEYVVDDHEKVARMLASYGVRVVFTGHFHALDATKAGWKDGSFVYDIETGSLVSVPNSIRFGVISGNVLSITTELITELPGKAYEKGFYDYSREFTGMGVIPYIVDKLTSLGAGKEESLRIAPAIAKAAVAHYEGDESFPGGEMFPTDGLSLMGSIAVNSKKGVIAAMWKDLDPPDAAFSIDLVTGNWKAAE